MSVERGVLPSERLRVLREALARKGFVRVIEAHSGLSGIIGDTANVVVDGETVEYDGLWESSLTDSATKGLPDASIIGNESRLHTIDEVLNVTSKPLIVDGDTGGEAVQFGYLVRQLERRGVSAVIIEDKVFPKRNSLDASAMQTLEDPEIFAQKIQHGKGVTLTDDFMIIARIESLIAGTGLQDALDRAEQYIMAGVDGIMIHSSRREPEDLFAFVDAYQPLCDRLGRRPTLVSVPTTYNQHSEAELVGLGFNVIIHANQLLRAAHKAMKETALRILETGSSAAADPQCSPVSEIFSAVGFDQITAGDRERSRALQVPVIIPAAGKDPIFTEGPKSLIPVAGRSILDYQQEEIRKAGLKQIVIVRGYEGDQFSGRFSADQNTTFCDNPLYLERHALHSLLQAGEHMGSGFLLVFSDLLFYGAILERLLRSGRDIVLGCDNSYTYHKHAIDKRLDLVVSRKSFDSQYRSLHSSPVFDLVRVGKDIEIQRADYEFIGMAYFSQEGARILRETYDDCAKNAVGPFHEASSFEMASITDMLQELIDRGFPMHGMEVSKGWMEIHRPEDVRIAEAELTSLPARR